jgi:Tol biopolymer transport system component
VKTTHSPSTVLVPRIASGTRCARALLLLAFAGGGLARAQTTRVSVSTGGAEANMDCVNSVVSADGRYVAFWSQASNLVPGDTNGFLDVFVRDRQLGTTARVSLTSGGAEGNGHSRFPSISADGRFVAFESSSSNLVPGDSNGRFDIFVRDRQLGTTERVSIATGGTQGTDDSSLPSISADGRYVAFESRANNLVPGDTNSADDIFVRDRQLGTTERVSVDSGGVQGNSSSHDASISGDGNFVAFDSYASNFVGMDTNGTVDVFVRDRLNSVTTRASSTPSGATGSGQSLVPSISGDGRYVAFRSTVGTLVAGDTNGVFDVFVHDRQTATTERVSVGPGGVQANGLSVVSGLAISADGRCVAFQSNATNLVAGDTNGFSDVFVRDRQTLTTERVSVSSGGVQGDINSSDPTISATGRYVAFQSSATNLVAGDTNGTPDAFLRDRDATGFTSLCDPGVGTVIVCPCANPPGGANRGCDNSSATGGASLSAGGVAYLASDSLVLTTSGERPTAFSIVLQGSTFLANGAIYGQGVRCAGGALKRLFAKTAVAGSISAPNFGGGDPSISARSAALGDVIVAGQSRWYLVYYRDPVVLGGCPPTSTFNATQTGRVTWWP